MVRYSLPFIREFLMRAELAGSQIVWTTGDAEKPTICFIATCEQGAELVPQERPAQLGRSWKIGTRMATVCITHRLVLSSKATSGPRWTRTTYLRVVVA